MGLRNILVGSAVGGFGFSAGRDAYRKLSRNIGLIIVAIVLLGGTAYSVWNLVRGHARPSVFRLIGCIVLAAVSTVATYFAVTMFTQSSTTTLTVFQRLVLTGAVQGVVALLALAVGAIQRPGRVRRFAIARHNLDFLDANGLRDVGGRDQTMVDSLGNELALDDQRLDAIVFKVPGRRGVRAKIELDADGRMLAYVPPPAA